MRPDLDAAPDFLRDFGGAAGNAAAFEERMLSWADGNLNEGGAEERTLDARDLKVGLFGDFLETRQQGKYVQWVPGPTGYTLEPCRSPSGEVLVPRVVMLME